MFVERVQQAEKQQAGLSRQQGLSNSLRNVSIAFLQDAFAGLALSGGCAFRELAARIAWRENSYSSSNSSGDSVPMMRTRAPSVSAIADDCGCQFPPALGRSLPPARSTPDHPGRAANVHCRDRAARPPVRCPSTSPRSLAVCAAIARTRSLHVQTPDGLFEAAQIFLRMDDRNPDQPSWLFAAT